MRDLYQLAKAENTYVSISFVSAAFPMHFSPQIESDHQTLIREATSFELSFLQFSHLQNMTLVSGVNGENVLAEPLP